MSRDLLPDSVCKPIFDRLPLPPIPGPPPSSPASKLLWANFARANLLTPNTTDPVISATEDAVLEACPMEQKPHRAFSDFLSETLGPIVTEKPFSFTVSLCPALQKLTGYSQYQEFSHILRVLSRRFVQGNERIPHDLLKHFRTIKLTDTSLLFLLQNHLSVPKKCEHENILTPALALRQAISSAPRTHAPLSSVDLAKFAAFPHLDLLHCLLCARLVQFQHFQKCHKGLFIDQAHLSANFNNKPVQIFVCTCGAAFASPLTAVAHAISYNHGTSWCLHHNDVLQLDSNLDGLRHIAHFHLSTPLEVALEHNLVRALPATTATYRTWFPANILATLLASFESHITVVEKILFSNLASRDNHAALVNANAGTAIFSYLHNYHKGQPVTRERDYINTMASLYSTENVYNVSGILEHRTIPDWLANVSGMNRPIGLADTDHPIVVLAHSSLFTIPSSSRVKSYDLREPILHRMVTPVLGLHNNALKYSTSTHTALKLIRRAPNKIFLLEIAAYDTSGKLDIDLMARQIALVFHISALVQTHTRTKPMLLLAVGNPPRIAFNRFSNLEIISTHRSAERHLAVYCDAASLLPLPLLGVLQGDVPDRRHHRIAVIPTSYHVGITPEASLLLTKLLEFLTEKLFWLKTRSPGSPAFSLRPKINIYIIVHVAHLPFLDPSI